MMMDLVLAEALQLFVQACSHRQIAREDIVSADQSRQPWVFAGGVGEGWSFTMGSSATCRLVVDTEGSLYHATRTWVLRQVPSWYQVRAGSYHLVASSPVEVCDDKFREAILASLLKFVDEVEQ